MFNFTNSINLQQLLHLWQKDGILNSSELEKTQSFIENQYQRKDIPLMYILIGLGAFITAFCLIAFLVITGIVNRSITGSFIWSFIFIALACFFHRKRNCKDQLYYNFSAQNTFYLMVAGKILFVIAFSEFFDGATNLNIAFAISIITVITYYIYELPLDRFLSLSAILFSIFFVIIEKNYGLLTDILINSFFFLQILVAALLLTKKKVKNAYIPLAYATVFSLCYIVYYFTTTSKIGYWNNTNIHNLIYIKAVLTTSLVSLIIFVAKKTVTKWKTEPIILACLSSILLGFISPPIVILAICFMILGYANHQKLLLTLGALLIPIFIYYYYYNLDVDLMTKSIILMSSGMLFIVGYFYMKVRKLDKEEIV